MNYLYTPRLHIPIDSPNFQYVSDWNQFIKAKSQLNIKETTSSSRLMEIFYSRLCLKQTLHKKGILPMWRDLALNKDHRISLYKHLPLSISHTQTASVAIVGEVEKVQSIGIDLEHRMRMINKPIQEFINHPDDENFSPITKWCLKEAAYKCFSNTPAPIKFKDLQIGKKTITHAPSHRNCLWEVIPFKDHVIAICYELKKPV